LNSGEWRLGQENEEEKRKEKKKNGEEMFRRMGR
jgi:hypothetical protein